MGERHFFIGVNSIAWWVNHCRCDEYQQMLLQLFFWPIACIHIIQPLQNHRLVVIQIDNWHVYLIGLETIIRHRKGNFLFFAAHINIGIICLQTSREMKIVF